MRILVSAENFYPRIGGAEVFLDEYMSVLSEKGNEVYILYAGEKKPGSRLRLLPQPKSYVYKNIPLFNRTVVREYLVNHKWKRLLRRYARELKPDVIFTQLEYTPSSVEVAKELGLPVVVFIHNYDHFCPALFQYCTPEKCDHRCFFCAPISYKLQHPFSMKYINWHAKAMAQADLIIANSNYTKNLLKKTYSLESEVLYPILDIGKYKVACNKKANKITFINPIRTKGAEIVLEIAQRMKDRQFLVVDGKDKYYIDQFRRLDNVEHLPWCDDIKKVYQDTWLLLVPSIWTEPFGRVIPEVQISGIPCITSNKGGIPEAVGNGGIVISDLYNIDEWVSAIRALDNHNKYQKLQTLAIANASRLTLDKQWSRFCAILKTSGSEALTSAINCRDLRS